MVPPEGAVPPNAGGGTKISTDYRFPGYQDHHIINVYHKNEAKSKKWKGMLKTLFGDDFDSDAFTVPIKQRVHSTRQHLSTQVWDNFIQEIEGHFDGNGKLTGNVNATSISKFRADTLLKMKESLGAMVGDENVGKCMGRMRIWPAVLDAKITENGVRVPHPLKNDFLKEGYKMGSSANRFGKFCAIASEGLDDAAKLASLKSLRKSVFRNALKHGTRIVLMSLMAVVTKTYAAVDAGIDITQYGWQEALAIKINEELDLNDMDKARQIVSQMFTTDQIAGGNRVEALTLANGQIIRQNDLTFICRWNGQGEITYWETYIVTEIKTNFSDGGAPKIALMRADSTPQFQKIRPP